MERIIIGPWYNVCIWYFCGYAMLPRSFDSKYMVSHVKVYIVSLKRLCCYSVDFAVQQLFQTSALPTSAFELLQWLQPCCILHALQYSRYALHQAIVLLLHQATITNIPTVAITWGRTGLTKIQCSYHTDQSTESTRPIVYSTISTTASATTTATTSIIWIN